MIEKHKYIFERLMPIIVIILLSGSYVYYKQKVKADRAVVLAKDAVIKQLKIDHSDSALLSTNKTLKALDTETGLDSLIINLK